MKRILLGTFLVFLGVGNVMAQQGAPVSSVDDNNYGVGYYPSVDAVGTVVVPDGGVGRSVSDNPGAVGRSVKDNAPSMGRPGGVGRDVAEGSSGGMGRSVSNDPGPVGVTGGVGRPTPAVTK